jgi:cell division protein FtsB
MSVLGWLVAVCVGIVAAWAYADLRDLRTVARERQIRIEEAQAWADKYERERDALAAECDRLREERDALAAECDRLREERATLRGLYVRRTRESLAANFWIIARNAERRR